MASKQELKNIINSQREQVILKDKGLTRTKLKEVVIRNNFALIISGIRRCGKSTLLLQSIAKQKNFHYLNFEDPRLKDFEINDFKILEEVFSEEGKSNLYYFDEIQNLDGWELYIRYLLDNNKLVVLTGSNASLLSRELGTKLTGRNLRLELFPMSFREFLQFRNLKPSAKAFEKYLKTGGFPEYIKTENQEILQNLLSDIISRDIIVRRNIRNSKLLYEITTYLLSNISKEFSHNNIRKMFNLGSVNTVSSFVSYLEDSYILFTIPKFSYSLKKQQVHNKKVFAIDSAFVKANSLDFSENSGQILENQVFIELRKKYRDIFYFQGEHECDFLIKEKMKITQAIQVCHEFNSDNKGREINGLLEPMEKFKLKEGLILTFNQEDKIVIDDKKIIVKPIWKWAG